MARGFRLPGPYSSRMNLPSVFLGLPFALLRSKLYNKFIAPTEGGVMAYPEEHPFAFLPFKGGYNSHPMPAMVAIGEARARLQALAETGRATAPPDMPATDFEVPYPRAEDRMYPHPPPGYNVREVPFHGSPGQLPDAVLRTQQVLQQHPWAESPAGTELAVDSPSSISDALQSAIPDFLRGGR